MSMWEIRSNSSENTKYSKSEILILGRFGIRQAYLDAALRLADQYQLHPAEILIRGKVISIDIWHRAQTLLAQEMIQKRRMKKQRKLLLWNAVNFLKSRRPDYSASVVAERKQLLVLGLFFLLLIFSIFSPYQNGLFVLLAFLTAFYTAAICFRGVLLSSFEPQLAKRSELIQSNDEELPVYCVLVALYKEANQIRTLTQSLSRLDWPKHKLDIKLICEADDHETIRSIQNAGLPEYFQLIVVPEQRPRTKPKALNFALPICQGEYLVLYDAEDLPSPGQLREAHRKFLESDKRLACVQAPLIIHNARQNWLTRMFAIEYLTLFRGILPVLAKWRAPLPLGGTSNHFKLSVLKDIGGWDPYNVTEDADLGIRLFRSGYFCSTITLPTYEECPPNFGPWLRQRTRWIKGWMQTILVHNRKPLKLAKQIGFRNTLIFHLFLTAIVISALIHPILMVASYIVLSNLSEISMSGHNSFFIMTSVFNLVGGYTTYAVLAFAVLRTSKQPIYAIWLITLPVYWLLISIAAWRGLFHLILKPHKWEKTPHGFSLPPAKPKL